MTEFVFWFVAALTIMSAAFVVLNNQLIYSAVALLFIIYNHRSNISRMREGTENRFKSIMIFKNQKTIEAILTEI